MHMCAIQYQHTLRRSHVNPFFMATQSSFRTGGLMARTDEPSIKLLNEELPEIDAEVVEVNMTPLKEYTVGVHTLQGCSRYVASTIVDH